jgi:hypothetical protein
MACEWRASLIFPDFEEFIASLNAHRVRYLIVGGYAVGFHARPRATKDIDILVDRSAANARRTPALHLRRLGLDEAAALLPDGIDDLASISAVLCGVPAVADGPYAGVLSADPEESVRRAFSALRGVLARMAAQRPVVLWIEDIHLADSAGSAELAELMKSGPARILVIST